MEWTMNVTSQVLLAETLFILLPVCYLRLQPQEWVLLRLPVEWGTNADISTRSETGDSWVNYEKLYL